MKYYITIVLSFILFTLESQNSKEFKNSFPFELIDSTIISFRNLEEKMTLLKTCDWKNRIGEKIDVFWLKTEQGSFFGHTFEYIMDCDNIRLIYWSPNAKNVFPIVDFMIEDLEEESQFVVAKKKHLKNQKKYQALLKLE